MATPPITFDGCIPYMWVSDVREAIGFYRDRLGFELVWDGHGTMEDTGEAWGMAQMARDGLDILVSTCNCRDDRHRGLGYFRLNVDPVRPLYDEYVEQGVTVLFGGIRDRDWGMREFTVEDPEGNRIEFAGPIPDGEDQCGGQARAARSIARRGIASAKDRHS